MQDPSFSSASHSSVKIGQVILHTYAHRHTDTSLLLAIALYLVFSYILAYFISLHFLSVLLLMNLSDQKKKKINNNKDCSQIFIKAIYFATMPCPYFRRVKLLFCCQSLKCLEIPRNPFQSFCKSFHLYISRVDSCAVP